MRKVDLAAAGLLVTVGLLYLVNVSRRDEPPPAQVPGDVASGDVDESSTVSADTEREDDSSGRVHLSEPATLDPGSIVAAPDMSIVRPPPASLESQLAPSPYELLLAGIFANEPIDVAWARRMEAEIHGILATGIPAVSTAAHCRTTMCRIEFITATDDADYAAFMRAFDSLRTGEDRLIGFLDTHRGSPTDSNPRFWQGYLAGPGMSQALRDEVERRARERFSMARSQEFLRQLGER